MGEPYDPRGQMTNDGVSHGFLEKRKSRRWLEGVWPHRAYLAGILKWTGARG